MARQKKPVTAGTLIRRINRVLAEKEQKLVKTSQDSAYELLLDRMADGMEKTIKAREEYAFEHGSYCLVNGKGEVIKNNLSLAWCGRSEGVLLPHEYIIDVSSDKDRTLANLEKTILKFESLMKKIVRYQRLGFQFPPDMQVSDELANKLNL